MHGDSPLGKYGVLMMEVDGHVAFLPIEGPDFIDHAGEGVEIAQPEALFWIDPQDGVPHVVAEADPEAGHYRYLRPAPFSAMLRQMELDFGLVQSV